jgi:hypothetical protein
MQGTTLFVLCACLLIAANASSITQHSSKHKTAKHTMFSKRNYSKAVRVRSNADAFKLLTQLGYNRCENLTDLKSNNQNETLCESSVESMLKKFQTTFHLPVTGKLDTATLKLMNRPRCNSLNSSSSFTDKNKLW